MAASMWLIVGLGNPGSEYAGTRHNLGFEVVERLARRWNVPLDRSGFDSRYGKGQVGGQDVVLLEPLTYMNLSGQSVLAAMQFYKLPVDRLIVVMDDLALPPGQIRVRLSGSAGGHKGLTDILARLGRDDVGRVRIGIGAVPGNWTGRDYVLSKPAGNERDLLVDAIETAADATDTWVRQGGQTAMNQYNRSREDGPGN